MKQAALLIAMTLLASSARGAMSKPDPLDPCNVVWDIPSKDSSGSMPLGNGDIGLNVWVDANQPVVWVEVHAQRPFDVRAELELWRKTSEITESTDRIVWFDRNESSIWEGTLKHQGLNEWIKRGRDPLIDRTFGGLIRGEGLVADGTRALRSAKPLRRCVISICVHASQSPTADEWLHEVTQVSPQDTTTSE